MTVILIPAYKPDMELLNLIDALYMEGFSILVVDDGSGPEYDLVFASAGEKAKVIHNPRNLGKGAALKNGMRNLMELFPDATHFITVDADGQHRLHDILKVRNALGQGASMVLTVRDFKGKIPFFSRLGNGLSRWVYTLLTGHYLSDNQSGLRGYSVEYIPWLIRVAGSRYDYEINVIYHADRQGITITTVPIRSVYLNDNQSSHFDPAKDTFRIYKQLFASAKGKVAASVIYEILIMIAGIIFGRKWWMITVPISGIIALAAHIMIDYENIRDRFIRNGWKGLDNITHSIARAIVYTVGTGILLSVLPMAPFMLVFNLVVLIMAPIRYNMHRLYSDRTRQHEESEADPHKQQLSLEQHNHAS
ncbi:MAG: glycosyltransferase family 2 protein [Lachnospiraceae bacterium]|nr:glycosyltransferase family 2 protein [Lachnospiraceae bacterium]